MKNWIFVTICLASGISNADHCDAIKMYSDPGGRYIGCKTAVDGHKQDYTANDITYEGCGGSVVPSLYSRRVTQL